MRSRQPAQSKRWMIPTIALFVALPLLLFVSSLGGDGSTHAPLLPERVPESYRITYRVGDGTSEVVRVRRPFDARIDTTKDGDEIAGRVSSLVTLSTWSPGTGWLQLATTPAIAVGDLRFDDVLRRAVADHRVDVRERRHVAGRECQVFRAGSSVSAGTLTPYDPASASWADICVDGDGLLLSEDWTVNGKLAQQRVATSVRTGEHHDDALFRVRDARVVGPADGGSLARRVDPASGPPGSYLALPSAPSGFRYLGRWALASTTDTQNRRTTLPTSSSVVDVWARGADVVVLEQGVTSQPLPPVTDLDLRANEVRIDQPDGGFARLYGTVSVARLRTLSHELVGVEGTGLRFLD